MTRQRRAILNAVQETDSHPTADDVYDRVRQTLPRISLGTVYRNLAELAERGMMQELRLGSGQKRFDGNTLDHCHVRCLSCGRVADAPIEVEALPEVSRLAEFGFEVIGCAVEVRVHCPRCVNEGQAGEPGEST